MNPISSARATQLESPYETNSRLYGPVVASAIGAVEATGGAASAVVDFSAEGLKKLGDALEAGYDDVADAATAVSDTVGSALGTVGQYAALGAAAGRQFFTDIV